MPRSKRKRIEVFSREDAELVEEIVFGEGLVRLAYGTRLGLWATTNILTRRWVSILVGLYYDSGLSRGKIESFARQLNIDLDECEKEIHHYGCFNEFFYRKLKAEYRPITAEPGAVASPGDGRLLVFPRIDEETLSYVKWAPVRLMDLFDQDRDLAERYQSGSCGVLRLCPADYHRFHFPVSGKPGPTTIVPGLLHSVSPYALEQKIPVYALNKRSLCTLKSEEFGEVLLMEVGALCVGSMVQTYRAHEETRLGEEKGFFKFGGSTVIFFFRENTVTFDEDLLQNSAQGVETIVKMGERIARTATKNLPQGASS